MNDAAAHGAIEDAEWLEHDPPSTAGSSPAAAARAVFRAERMVLRAGAVAQAALPRSA